MLRTGTERRVRERRVSHEFHGKAYSADSHRLWNQEAGRTTVVKGFHYISCIIRMSSIARVNAFVNTSPLALNSKLTEERTGTAGGVTPAESKPGVGRAGLRGREQIWNQ